MNTNIKIALWQVVILSFAATTLLCLNESPKAKPLAKKQTVEKAQPETKSTFDSANIFKGFIEPKFNLYMNDPTMTGCQKTRPKPKSNKEGC